jgi:hypothetical protein
MTGGHIFWSVLTSNTLTVRNALQHSPRNIYTLINVLSDHLFRLLRSSSFPSPNQQSNIPVPQSIKKTWTGGITPKDGEDPTREALNCVRVLGRVLVVVYENDQDEDIPDEAQAPESETTVPTDAQLREHFAWNTLWKRSWTPSQGSAPGKNQSHAAAGPGADARLPSLADNLFDCTIDLLFCAGFTVPESVRGQSKDKINVGTDG